MNFKFWKRIGGVSPPEEYLLNIRNKQEKDDIHDKLKIIQRQGMEKSKDEYKVICFSKKESIYQLNKKRHRVLFILRENIGWICDAFLKRSREDEQKHYKLVYKRAKNI